jgi:hypothetical protein
MFAIIRRARYLFREAVRKGQLVRPTTCERCGRIPANVRPDDLFAPPNVRRISGHHTDYTKPLDVQWLCHWCHTEADSEVRRSQGRVWHKPTKSVGQTPAARLGNSVDVVR